MIVLPLLVSLVVMLTAPPAQHAAIRSFDADYKWFDSLDFDAVRSGSFVRTPLWPNSLPDESNPRSYSYGFAFGKPEEQFFLGFQPDLHFSWTPREPDLLEGLELIDLGGFAKTDLERKAPVMNWTLNWFLMARALDARGYHDLAKRYLQKILHEGWPVIYKDPVMPWNMIDTEEHLRALKMWSRVKIVAYGLQDEVAECQVHDFINRFKDRDIPWAQHLKEAERLDRLFDSTRLGSTVKEYAAAARQNVLTNGPHGSSIDDLIAELPEENAQQFMIPGSPDVFGFPGTGADSPAHKLVALGRAAVPALTRALKDHRFTRCVGGGRSTDSVYVLRVSDLAGQILDRIPPAP